MVIWEWNRLEIVKLLLLCYLGWFVYSFGLEIYFMLFSKFSSWKCKFWHAMLHNCEWWWNLVFRLRPIYWEGENCALMVCLLYVLLLSPLLQIPALPNPVPFEGCFLSFLLCATASSDQNLGSSFTHWYSFRCFSSEFYCWLLVLVFVWSL